MKFKSKIVISSKMDILVLMIILLNLLVPINIKYYFFYAPITAYINMVLYIYLIVKYNFIKLEKKEFVFIGVIIIYSIAVSLFNGNSVGAVIAYLNMFLVLLVFKRCQISDFGWKMMIIVTSFTFLKYFFVLKNYYEQWFYNLYNLVNPNIISFFLYFMFVILIYYQCRNCKQNKLIYFIEWLIFEIMVYGLRCRTYMVAGVIVGICLLIIPHKFFTYRKTVFIVITLFFLGCWIPYIYTLLSDNFELTRTIYKYTGKYLYTGREAIWINFFKYEFSNIKGFIFGVGSGSEHIFSSKYSLHNSYLGVIMNFGIVGLALYLYYIISYIKNFWEKIDEIKEYHYVMIFGFIGYLVSSFSEVTIQTPVYSLLVGIVLAAINNSKDV